MRWIFAVALAGCGFRTAPMAADAGRPSDALTPDLYQCVHVHLDAGDWGGQCSTTQTALCHDDLGWCIDGTCRPQCLQPLGCLACEGTDVHFNDAGQCYCAP